MARLLFVVHRYVPFPGGSEYFVRDMAEESLKRGHAVTVLTHWHRGDRNGVRVTNDYGVLNAAWDLIVVHGGDVVSQDVVHAKAREIRSPVIYLIVKPSEAPVCLAGLAHHRFVGYSTAADLRHIGTHGLLEKARRVRHGISPKGTVRKKPARGNRRIFVSAGGYSHHKAMVPLAGAFTRAGIPDSELHLFGCFGGGIPSPTEIVKVSIGTSRETVMLAVAGAEAYVMNSQEEGFGLVLLEAMANRTPWIARNVGGAVDLSSFGTTYRTEEELIEILRRFRPAEAAIERAYDYLMANHTIRHTIDDVEAVLEELSR